MTQALLFDMDGLLLDTERVALDAFLDAASDHAFDDAEAFFLSLVGSSSGHTTLRLKEAGIERADQFQATWGRGFEARIAEDVPVKPGVRDVLQQLSETSLPMVVVTSTRGAAARAQLGRAGLMAHFRDLVGGDEVRANKPDSAPYLLGAERAGAAATACFAFEDSDMGVASAVAAGCRVSQVPDLRPHAEPLPALGQGVYTSLREAMEAQGLLTDTRTDDAPGKMPALAAPAKG